MPRVFSQSQGKFIDQPEAGAGAGMGGLGMGGVGAGGDSNMMSQLLLILALQDPKNISKYTGLQALSEKAFPGPTEKAREMGEERKKAEQILSEMENKYFGNQLHYGFTSEGIKKSAAALVNPNSDLAVYKRFSKSKGVTLAKLAGDVGNIAWAEQQAQLKALAGGTHDYQHAVDQFNLVREGFGLESRDYTKIGGARKEEVTGRPAPGVAPPTGAPPEAPKGMEIPFGALGQLIGSRLPFPYNIAGAGAIGGLGTALPITGERAGMAARGETPPYGQQLTETAGGMGQVGKTVGINALLQAILSPVKTTGGLRDIAAGTQAGKAAGVPELLETKRMGWAPKYEGAPFEQVQPGVEQAKGIQQYLGSDFPIVSLLDKLLSGAMKTGQAARTGAGMFGKSAIRALPWLGGGALLGKYGGVF